MSEMISNVGDRVVVGVDMSESGDHALREAMRLCRRLQGSELHVANVIYVERSLHDAHRIAQLANLLHTRIDALREHVSQLCRPSGDEPAFTQETVFHVRLGEPADALHQVAIDVDADLIVVGTHARRGMGKLLLGSVAESLIHIAHVPVSKDRTVEVPAHPVAKVVDTTGAGDLFAAGFLYGYTHDRSLADSARLGAISAAEVISHFGARPEVSLRELVAKSGL